MSPCGQGAKLRSEPRQAGSALGLTCAPWEGHVRPPLSTVLGGGSQPRAHAAAWVNATIDPWGPGEAPSATLDKVAWAAPPQASASSQLRLSPKVHLTPAGRAVTATQSPCPAPRPVCCEPPGCAGFCGGWAELGGRAHRLQAENLPRHRGPSSGPEPPRTGKLSLGPGPGVEGGDRGWGGGP